MSRERSIERIQSVLDSVMLDLGEHYTEDRFVSAMRAQIRYARELLDSGNLQACAITLSAVLVGLNESGGDE